MYQVEISDSVIKENIIEGEIVLRDPEEISLEQHELKEAKRLEVQALVDSYVAAQQHQLIHGGPGPVAEFEIMKIVNEYAGEFEVVFKGE